MWSYWEESGGSFKAVVLPALGLLNPVAGQGCTHRDPCGSPRSTELGRAPKSASSVNQLHLPLMPCLLSSPLLSGLSLALTPLLTQERSSITVSATLGGSRTAHPPQCLVLCQDSVYLLGPSVPGHRASSPLLPMC